MRNVTISLDDETARWARIEAARNDTSVSKWVGQLLDEQRRRTTLDYDRAQRSYFSRGSVSLKSPDATYPDRADLHDR